MGPLLTLSGKPVAWLQAGSHHAGALLKSFPVQAKVLFSLFRTKMRA